MSWQSCPDPATGDMHVADADRPRQGNQCRERRMRPQGRSSRSKADGNSSLIERLTSGPLRRAPLLGSAGVTAVGAHLLAGDAATSPQSAQTVIGAQIG